MKMTEGLINSKKPKPADPKPSPKGFLWPPQDHDDKVAQKIAASLQELLPARGWTHVDLAKELWGTMGENGGPRNVAPPRRWVTAEHPIPSPRDAAYLAEALGVSMARLLEPEGKFDPHPPMIRGRKDSKRFPVKPGAWSKAKAKIAGAEVVAKSKRPYLRKAAALNGHAMPADPNAWVLEKGIPVPECQLSFEKEFPGHMKVSVNAVLPYPRAMAILHMLEHTKAPEE
jgi:hypothetical protein